MERLSLVWMLPLIVVPALAQGSPPTCPTLSTLFDNNPNLAMWRDLFPPAGTGDVACPAGTYNCLVDPCQVRKACPAGTSCFSDYCGGCFGRCKVNVAPEDPFTLLLPLPKNFSALAGALSDEQAATMSNFVLPGVFSQVSELLDAGELATIANTTITVAANSWRDGTADRILASFEGLTGANKTAFILPVSFPVGQGVAYLIEPNWEWLE